MTLQPPNWRASPQAAEFLPEEIARLAAGTMELCSECQSPRPAHTPCEKCETCNSDQDRNRKTLQRASSRGTPQ